MPNTPGTPRKAAIYLRISLDREMGDLAIDRQREQCEALAAYRQWEVVETYVDQSKSATDRTKVRPAYDQMVADYKAGAFDAIICYDLDRLTRQPRELEDWSMPPSCAASPSSPPTATPTSPPTAGACTLASRPLSPRAEMERKGARQSAAQLQRAKQGRAPKGMCPLGYAVDGEVFEGNRELIEVDNAHAPLTLENSQSNRTTIIALPLPIARTDNRSERRDAGGVGEQSRGRKHGDPIDACDRKVEMWV